MKAVILYYSSNREHPDFEARVIENLLANCGDLPIISVTQKPLDLGQNICVGDVGASGFNMFRQVELGCEAAAGADLIISAEADCLYPPDYFTYRPPRLDLCYRNSNLYVMPDKRSYFFRKPGGATHAQAVGREFYLVRLRWLFRGAPQWSVSEKNFPKERHRRSDVFYHIEYWATANPVVQIKTHRGHALLHPFGAGGHPRAALLGRRETITGADAVRLSVIIPAYQEPYLQRTVDSLLAASVLGGGLEVIVVLDGAWLKEPLRPDRRLQVVQLEGQQGLRAAINAGLKLSRGRYVMKVDAHCAFSPGFDLAMAAACEPDWVMIPRRYALEVGTWTPTRTGHPRDYHYLNYPGPEAGGAMTAHHWDRRERREWPLDETMTFQGSCWLVERNYFTQLIKRLDDNPGTYGPYWLEYVEIGLKYWLTGGRVLVNKEAWYAHLYKKPRLGFNRNYKRDSRHLTWIARHWLNNEEPGLKYPFGWLVEHFWPVPTWPANRNLWRLS